VRLRGLGDGLLHHDACLVEQRQRDVHLGEEQVDRAAVVGRERRRTRVGLGEAHAAAPPLLGGGGAHAG